MAYKILVVTSTFPSSDSDPVPAFVKDQIDALKTEYPNLVFSVLVPHDAHSFTWFSEIAHSENKNYQEYRFHYFWPFCFEKLTGRGIIPTLKKNPTYYGLIPFLVIAEFFALLNLSRKLKPDIIYAHWFTPQGIIAGLVSGITKIPFVYTSHSSDVAILHKISFIGSFLVRTFSKRARAITVVSRRSLEKLQRFFNNQQWNDISKKVTIIPMGVKVNTDTKFYKRPNEKKINILFLGRLVEKKGVQYLLPAFSIICKSVPTAVLTIAGDGPWLNRLVHHAEELNIPNERLKFTGHVSGDVKTKLISNADIFVIPSIITDDGDAEGLPVTLLEGLAAGKICVATYESGADDILENEVDGFLVPQKNIDALATALINSIHLTSSDVWIKMQKNAQMVASLFGWPEIAKQHYKALFEK